MQHYNIMQQQQTKSYTKIITNLTWDEGSYFQPLPPLSYDKVGRHFLPQIPGVFLLASPGGPSMLWARPSGDWSQHALREPGRHSTEVWDSNSNTGEGIFTEKTVVFWELGNSLGRNFVSFFLVGKKFWEDFFFFWLL